MIKRKLETQINEWLNKSKKALLLTGARQTGKTTIIRGILETTQTDYLEINFIEHPEMISVFQNARDTSDLLFRMSAISNEKLPEKGGVIFLDEVQECKDMITRIKFLVENGEYRYILSGSLLGVELSDLRSAPVGYLQILDMYPLDIEEFFSSIGLSDDVLRYIRDCYENRKPLSDEIHNRLLDAFYLYLIIGGMPEAVQTYLDTNRFDDVSSVQESIIKLYHADYSKYDKAQKLQLKEVYESIPGELQEKNKRFYINHLAGKKEYDMVKNSFLWLKNAGVAIPVYNVKEPLKPLVISEKRSLFKLFVSDVGLLTAQYSPDVRIDILNKAPGINNGGLFENVVTEELISKGIQPYYYNSKKYGEVDLLIELDGKVLPIEVKSGKDYSRHSALDNLIKSDNYNIPEAYVLCNSNLYTTGKITYLPIYMVFCIENKTLSDAPYKISLSDLTIVK